MFLLVIGFIECLCELFGLLSDYHNTQVEAKSLQQTSTIGLNNSNVRPLITSFIVRYLFFFNIILKMFLSLFVGSLMRCELYVHMTKHGD